MICTLYLLFLYGRWSKSSKIIIGYFLLLNTVKYLFSIIMLIIWFNSIIKVTLFYLYLIFYRYGHFSGINRKVQMKYQPRGRPRGSSSDDGNSSSHTNSTSMKFLLCLFYIIYDIFIMFLIFFVILCLQ